MKDANQQQVMVQVTATPSPYFSQIDPLREPEVAVITTSTEPAQEGAPSYTADPEWHYESPNAHLPVSELSAEVPHRGPTDLNRERSREISWLARHPSTVALFGGQWLALDGDNLVAHGTDIESVLRQAEEGGIPRPFLTKVPDDAVTYLF